MASEHHLADAALQQSLADREQRRATVTPGRSILDVSPAHKHTYSRELSSWQCKTCGTDADFCTQPLQTDHND